MTHPFDEEAIITAAKCLGMYRDEAYATLEAAWASLESRGLIPQCKTEELRLLHRIDGLIAENDRLREALKQIDDHMVLVPRAPTNDMLDAGLEEDTWSPLEIYRAMIAASQEPKT